MSYCLWCPIACSIASGHVTVRDISSEDFSCRGHYARAVPTESLWIDHSAWMVGCPLKGLAPARAKHTGVQKETPFCSFASPSRSSKCLGIFNYVAAFVTPAMDDLICINQLRSWDCLELSHPQGLDSCHVIMDHVIV